MLNYYGLIATNIFITYFFITLLAPLAKKYRFAITLVLIAIFNTVPALHNLTIAELASGYVGYLSICSVLLMLIVISSKLCTTQVTTFAYTSLAFLIMCIVFYVCFFISSYKLYDLGFNPYMILLVVFAYGITLLLISNKFILFNSILLVSTLVFFSALLQLNIWNYIVDPILIIVSLIEIISTLVVLTTKKNKNITLKKF